MPADTLDLGAGKQRKSLVALPADLASKHEIKHLVASKCEHLRTLDAASELVSLESIAVDRCPALDLEAAISTLARLPRLVEVQLGHRDLSHLPRQLASLRSVESLTIVDGGQLDFDDAFALLAEMPGLRWLRIVQRKRIALPASIARLVELRGLLAHGALKRVPDEIRRLEKLEQLSIGGARLGEVPDAIFALANLRTLDLSTNELRALPERIAALARLESLDLRANPIGTVPSAIGRLQALRTLDLSFCEIDRLPDELGDLAQLETLSMIENRLEALPDSITRLANLRRLEVKQAPRLRTLPEHIGRLTKLEALGLQMTKLEALPESIGDLENLTELQLSSVPLSTLPDSFARLRRLRQLSLGGTRFASVPAALEAMEALEELRLFGENEPPVELGELFAILGRLPKLSLLVVNDLRGAEPLQGRKDYVRLPPSMGDLRSVRELYLGGSWPPWVGELPATVLQLENLRELGFEDLAFEGPAEVTARLPKGRWRRTENNDGTMYRRTDAE